MLKESSEIEMEHLLLSKNVINDSFWSGSFQLSGQQSDQNLYYKSFT